jgi:hypothetical protein
MMLLRNRKINIPALYIENWLHMKEEEETVDDDSHWQI